MEEKIFVCENCGKEHDGSYGSGRFCSSTCRSKFNGKQSNKNGKLNYNNFKQGHKKKEGGWKCFYCGEIFETRRKKQLHFKEKHSMTVKIGGWSKGLTKETSPSLRRKSETYRKHLEEGKIIPSQLGKPLSESHKKKISESMKKAHAEGRAHNIGESRWNNKPSYPEKWFIKMLLNEFQLQENIDSKREHPFHGYSLDFAWIEEKKAIEIDGEQHERFQEQKERDKNKDALLESEGWKYLRISWKDIFHNTKYWIKIIKEFLKDDFNACITQLVE